MKEDIKSLSITIFFVLIITFISVFAYRCMFYVIDNYNIKILIEENIDRK